MKVLLAYDGSAHSDAALKDLRQAGFPAGTEVLVVAVADLLTFDPAISETEEYSPSSPKVEAVLSRSRANRERIIRETENFAAEAAARLRIGNPEWEVRSVVLQGTPAEELLRQAAEWKADLIVAGSQGRSAIGRLFLGSVSKRVADEAKCSVRVVPRGFEKTEDEPIKIIASACGLKDAEMVIKSISRRFWSSETKVRLLAIDDGFSPGRVSAVYPDARALFEQAAEPLLSAGHQLMVEIKSGNPRSILLEAAESWKTHSIFLAACYDNPDQGLDDTAAALITGARCAVEVVR